MSQVERMAPLERYNGNNRAIVNPVELGLIITNFAKAKIFVAVFSTGVDVDIEINAPMLPDNGKYMTQREILSSLAKRFGDALLDSFPGKAERCAAVLLSTRSHADTGKRTVRLEVRNDS